jgi:hypothetical protein
MKAMNVFFALLLAASLAWNVWLWTLANKPAEVMVETHTEYVMIRDSMPTATESHLTGDVIKVTAQVHKHAKNHEPDVEATELEPDTTATVWLNGDSATVVLPIMQKVYVDSLYTAYVSGFSPRLDSIDLRLPHTFTTITRTVSKPARRWAVGPVVGAGYGVVSRQMDVFVGVGVTWNILP